MKHIIILVLLIFLIAGCRPSQETLATQTTDAETPTSTPTVTSTPTETNTPTPETPRPAMSPELAPINNASMAYENGTWVTKNAAGKTSSTWDSAKNEWTYNYENITTQYAIAGWYEGLTERTGLTFSSQNHPECFVRAPHDESLNLVDVNGTPYKDGYIGQMIEDGYTLNMYAARFITLFDIGPQTGWVASVICAQVEATPDKTIVLPLYVGGPSELSVRTRTYKLLQNDSVTWEKIGLTDMQLFETLRKMEPGQQFMFVFQDNEPLDAFFNAMENPADFSGTLATNVRITHFSFGFPERFYTP